MSKQISSVKKDLSKINMEDIQLTGGNKMLKAYVSIIARCGPKPNHYTEWVTFLRINQNTKERSTTNNISYKRYRIAFRGCFLNPPRKIYYGVIVALI